MSSRHCWKCSGVVLVYGQTPATWVQAQFAFTRRVIAPRKREASRIALLDVAPQSRPLRAAREPGQLLTLDCRQGLDTQKSSLLFVELLRQNRGSPAAWGFSKSQRPAPGRQAVEQHEPRLFFRSREPRRPTPGDLARARFLAVIGPSGSGKSSLVRAGMLPALAGWLGTGSDWRIVTLRPGDRPLRRLATGAQATRLRRTPPFWGQRLGSVRNHAGSYRGEIRRGPLGLVHLVEDIRAGTASPTRFNLLILVDRI